MTEEEIESTAQCAIRDESCVDELVLWSHENVWPRWKRGSVASRMSQELNSHDGANPIKARTWLAALRLTGSDEMFALAKEAHREGKTRRAERAHSRAVEDLERERGRRRMRRVEVPEVVDGFDRRRA